VIRFAWTQSRIPAAAGAAGLVVVALVLGLTGPHLAHLYAVTLAGCRPADCSDARSAFQNNDHTLHTAVDALVVVVPALIGMFWGAPLIARELETGTWRLAWTQSVTRTRWLACRLGVLGLGAVLAGGLLSLMATWWSSPLDQATMSRYGSFDRRDLVPLGYAAFAFVLAAALGMLIRRTLPAMACTLAGFIAVRIAVTDWIRPNLLPPTRQQLAVDDASGAWGYGSSTGLFGLSKQSTLMPADLNIPNSWTTSTQLVDASGHVLTPQDVANACPVLAAGHPGSVGLGGGQTQVHATGTALQDCVTKIGATYHEVVAYQPAGHYWPLQWLETAVYLAAAGLIAAFCLWRVRRGTASRRSFPSMRMRRGLTR
jgi:hypothetical protein